MYLKIPTLTNSRVIEPTTTTEPTEQFNMNIMKKAAAAAAISTLLILLTTPTNAQETQHVQTTMCRICNDNEIDDTSSQDCRTYTTPLNTCYNAQTLFPDDPSWSTLDIYDTMSMKSLKRTFYKSQDGSCSNVVHNVQDVEIINRARLSSSLYKNENVLMKTKTTQEDDYFILPFDECVGPFGEPRPWGKFTLVQSGDGMRLGLGLDDLNEVAVEK
jgi:hypothetical protein